MYFRHTGSIVADFHRTLMYGGIMLLPSTKEDPDGTTSIFDAFCLNYLIDKCFEKCSTGLEGELLSKRPKRMN